jgi:hypothetical protein
MTGHAPRKPTSRVLPRARAAASESRRHTPTDGPRKVVKTIIDFRTLTLPHDVRLALADAFWNHLGARTPTAICYAWQRVKLFARFVDETAAVRRAADLNGPLLIRYVEWLGRQRSQTGEPWGKVTRSAAYAVLRKLFQWLERCRPGLIEPMEYPFNPFPWRNRDARHRRRLPPQQLRAILRACEDDIRRLRAVRDTVATEPSPSTNGIVSPFQSLRSLVTDLDAHFGGILPPTAALMGRAHRVLRERIRECGAVEHVRDCLYPISDTIMPYYIAILIHTAGNPEAIAALGCDCLQSLPLLSDQEVLVWDKPRASSVQRRSFRSAAPLEPPTLVRELLEWTRRLRPLAPQMQRERLFLFKASRGITALSPANLIHVRRRFASRHGLPDFELASIRPSVLTTFYRATGDLSQVRAIANHAHLSTTVAYVEGPIVNAENQARVATLQHAYLGYLDNATHLDPEVPSVMPTGVGEATPIREAPPGSVVSMFGFGCTDPFAGIAPGTRAGELCTNFLGCFTCPNAVLGSDERTLARLLQARDHLQAAATQLHPARWEAIYAPQLRILEEDILTRFSGRDLVNARRLRSTLPSLPPLR